jgi:hypothetical protein|tara:strand:- start:92 stop:379 length:288 start_codon:yes stop_codon:yes gene_type:complete
MRYLLIQYIRKANGQIDELIQTSRKLKKSDMNTKNIIMDYADHSVKKCVIEGSDHDTTFDLMHEYYKRIYPRLVEQLEKEAQIEAKDKRNKKIDK